MLRLRKLYALPIVVAILIFTGCHNNPNPVESFHSTNQTVSPKLTIPVGATLDSAIFYINVTNASGEEVTLHGITNEWEEDNVTWNNFGGSFNAASEGSFTPSGTGWYFVDVTALVNSWLDSSFANNGILLKEESPAQMQYFSSRETAMGPYLKIYWTLNGMNGYDSSGAYADAFINSDEGDENYGDSTALITGWQDSVETHSLVSFEIEQTHVGYGCTHGFGYWKTHSIFGPAPYDSTWALLGEDSTFFLSNKSDYEVMWTQPRHGNAYYILAHQYIATDLNFLHGADPSEIQDAFNDATALFITYTPEQIGQLGGADSLRHQFITLQGQLAEYNSGEIGPGSCDETTSLYPATTK
jgi:hypothetical protein